jgi:hypothetical protein
VTYFQVVRERVLAACLLAKSSLPWLPDGSPARLKITHSRHRHTMQRSEQKRSASEGMATVSRPAVNSPSNSACRRRRIVVRSRRFHLSGPSRPARQGGPRIRLPTVGGGCGGLGAVAEPARARPSETRDSRERGFASRHASTSTSTMRFRRGAGPRQAPARAAASLWEKGDVRQHRPSR